MDNRELSPAAHILTDVGRVLADDSIDWRAKLAVVLRVRRDTIRDWLSGRIPFDANHSALDDLLKILASRERELREVRERLERYLKTERGEN